MIDIHIIPVFPLGIVALPGQQIPLHIFEERYKLMIRDCLNVDAPFGIVLFSGDRMQDVGCTVRVIQIIHAYDDGRMDILTQGEKRFVIQTLVEDKPYLQASVTFFDDLPEAVDAGLRKTAQNGLALLRELERHLSVRTKEDVLDVDDMKQVSFALAGSEGFSAEEKQTFLEMTSTRARIEKSTRTMASTIERVRLTEKIHAIIRGNGHLDESLRSESLQDRATDL